MASFESEDQSGSNSFGDPAGDSGNQNNQQEVTIDYGGRKMSQQDILTKLENADKHIQTLESERSTDRERVEKLTAELEAASKNQKDMTEILERLDNNAGRQNADENNGPKAVDPDELAERAANAAYNRMTQEQRVAKQKQNLTQVAATLKEKFGDSVDEKVFAVTRDLGYSDEEAFKLAGERPKAFLRLVGVGPQESNSSSPTSTQSNVRNPDKPTDNPAPNRIHGAHTTKHRVQQYEARMSEKLKQLGIE